MTLESVLAHPMQRTILKILWAAGGEEDRPLTNVQIWEALKLYGFTVGKTTVCTVTDRMADDGLLVDHQAEFDCRHSYTPAYTKVQVAGAMQAIIEDITGCR